MRAPTLRFRLWQIMAIAAVLAPLFAALAFDAITTIAVLLIAGAMLGPVGAVRPGRRLGAAAWSASLYPLLPFVFLYATWLTAWIVLGHRPRSSLDDPKSISPIVLFPYASTFFAAMSAPFGLCVSYPLMIAHIVRRIRRDRIGPEKVAALGLLPVLVWLAMWALAFLPPDGLREIMVWYAD